MTEDVLLDTHIASWLDNGDDRLRGPTTALIDDCWRNGGTVFISAVTAWEIAQLIHSQRIDLDLSAEAWVERFIGRPGIQAVPLSYRAAARAYNMRHLEHRDPADRLLIATAIELTCPLITYDARITRFAENHGGECGFTVAA